MNLIFLTQVGNGGIYKARQAAAAAAAAKDKATDSGGSSLSGITKTVNEDGDTFYEFNQGRNSIEFEVVNQSYIGDKSNEVNFRVNGRYYAAGNISPQDGAAIASRVSSIMKSDAATRPDGFLYSTTAAVGDGRGSSRTALYSRAGFSLPSATSQDKTQYAVVKNGKLVPSTKDGKAYNATQLAKHRQQVRDSIRQAAKERRAARQQNAA